MSKPRKKSKKILFILEIVVLLLFIGGLFVYVRSQPNWIRSTSRKQILQTRIL